MEPVSFLLTILGLGFSGAAYFKATSAKKAIDLVIAKSNSREDLEHLQKLRSQIEKAQESAKPWCANSPEKFRQGRDDSDDLKIIFDAIDQMNSRAPIGLGEKFDERLKLFSHEIGKLYERIISPEVNENCWDSLLTELQSLTRFLRGLERDLKNASIAT